MRKTRIFFDMDGTLNQWESWRSLDEVSAPAYNRYLTPQANIVGAARLLSGLYETWIASAVFPYEYVIPDKDYWNDRCVSFIPKEHRIYIPYGTNKSAYLSRVARPGDILVDDYTPNLLDAKGIGMIGVKCLNGINDTHHSWKGARISIYSDPASIAAAIIGLAQFGEYGEFRETN